MKCSEITLARNIGLEKEQYTLEDLVDHEYIAYCAREAAHDVTLEEVLEATSKIEGSMAQVIIAEVRADRF